MQTQQSIELIGGLERVLGRGSLFAYLVNMTARIAEIHRVLKSTGSFYLHCDTVADSYLRLICDAVFVPNGGDFKNEITWKRADAHNDAKKQFAMISDRILFYTKSSKDFMFNPQYGGFQDKTLRDWYQWLEFPDGTTRRMTKLERETQSIPDDAKRFNTDNLRSPSPRPNLTYDYKGYKPHKNGWAVSIERMRDLDEQGLLLFPTNPDGRIMRKRYLDEQGGAVLGDVWTDVSQLRGKDAEKLGYPTQKPEALLERIISASSNEGDTILDAYCWCGTTVAVAQRLKRHWIGIDITYQSVALVLRRLESAFGKAVLDQITLNGIPRDMKSAVALANKKDDRLRKEFEKWAALTYTNNRAIINDRKGADRGIDGVAYFMTGKKDNAKIILQVKSGGVKRNDIATLRGDMEREKAALAVLVTLENPTKPMIEEAKAAGQYHHEQMGRSYDRIQIVTIQEILERDKRLDVPMSLEVLKNAQREVESNQMSLIPET